MVRTKAGQVPPIEPWPVQCQHHDHHANYQIGDALRWQMNTTSRPRPFRLGCLVWATGSRVEYARPSWGCSTRSSSSAHTHTNTTSPFIHALAGQWRPDQTRPDHVLATDSLQRPSILTRSTVHHHSAFVSGRGHIGRALDDGGVSIILCIPCSKVNKSKCTEADIAAGTIHHWPRTGPTVNLDRHRWLAVTSCEQCFPCDSCVCL